MQATTICDKLHGRHGNHMMRVRGLHDENGAFVELDEALRVMVHDNSDDGLTPEEVRKIAEQACVNPIFWSDDRCCHWMFDFNVWDHWCEMVNDESEPYYECLHINVYQ